MACRWYAMSITRMDHIPLKYYSQGEHHNFNEALASFNVCRSDSKLFFGKYDLDYELSYT